MHNFSWWFVGIPNQPGFQYCAVFFYSLLSTAAIVNERERGFEEHKTEVFGELACQFGISQGGTTSPSRISFVTLEENTHKALYVFPKNYIKYLPKEIK